MKLDRRQTLGAIGTVAALPLMAATTTLDGPVVTPEQFGAKGDGRTNDTAAFGAMTAHINRLGGGTIILRPVTYVVGRQAPDPAKGYAFAPASIMDFKGCSLPLAIRGNGARLRCASGLRFGTFDPRSGLPTSHEQPFTRAGELASPYFAMIKVEDCSSRVEIDNLELDGNAKQLRIGGRWGDTGWQIGCNGLMLRNNSAPIVVTRIRSHHHAKDGGMGDGHGVPGRNESVIVRDCRFFNNGRNAWSMVGGVGWRFERCRFDSSARHVGFAGSAPKAGIDFEAEGGKSVAQILLVDCSADDNSGVACLHPGSSRVSDVYWQGGELVGTTAWSYFGGGNKGIRFRNTRFFGALVNLAEELFTECTFSDDASAAPGRRLHNPNGFIIPDATTGTRFIRCRFIHTTPVHSANGNQDKPVFEDCTFISAKGAGRLDVYGRFRGRSTRFIAERGGTDFAVTPEGVTGGKSAGRAEDPFTITFTNGLTRTYAPGRVRNRG